MQLTSQTAIEVDVYVENHGTIFLVRPVSPFAEEWIQENVSEDSLHFGNALVCEHRFICNLVEGMRSDGLEVAA